MLYFLFLLQILLIICAHMDIMSAGIQYENVNMYLFDLNFGLV